VGREFVLACDMRFAALESAIFGQPEVGFGLIPGSGAVRHLARLMSRVRALEVLLSAEDYDAGMAECYGSINRALPAAALCDFVKSLARRIASFPASALAVVKERVNASALAPAEDFRRDSSLFLDCVRNLPLAAVLAIWKEWSLVSPPLHLKLNYHVLSQTPR